MEMPTEGEDMECLKRELSECRNLLEQWKDRADFLEEQRDDTREFYDQAVGANLVLEARLAAAETRRRQVVQLLDHIPQVAPWQDPDRPWIPGGSFLVGEVSEAIDVAREKLRNKDHVALDAVSERAKGAASPAYTDRLVALTPGGPEFEGNPERALEWIEERMPFVIGYVRRARRAERVLRDAKSLIVQRAGVLLSMEEQGVLEAIDECLEQNGGEE